MTTGFDRSGSAYPPVTTAIPERGSSETGLRNRVSEVTTAQVFLMQNHPLMVLGTTTFLNRQPGLAVVGSAITPEHALQSLRHPLPDVVVLEVSINGPYDFSFLKRLRQSYASLRILVYSYHEEVIFARRALAAGANGYLMKEAEPEQLADAIRTLLVGDVYISPRVAARIEEEQCLRTRTRPPLNGARVNSLSIRELQIFQHIGDGVSFTDIQRQLDLSKKSLSNTCYRIRKKLDLESETELVQFACHWAYYEGDFS